MNALDLVLLIAAAAAIVGGVRLGFATRVLSWVGLVVGLLLAIRVLPWVLDRLAGADRLPLVLASVAVVLLGAMLGQAIGLAVGSRFAPRPPPGPARAVDRTLGGLAGLVGLAALVWLLLPLLAATPGWPARLTSGSRLARAFAEDLPTAPDAAQLVRTLVGPGRYPAVLSELGPSGTDLTPPAATGLDAATSAAVARSVVKVEGISCQRVLDGSGFVVGDGLVATNAHVVAGEPATTVIRDDGRRLHATVVAYDPERDLALLAVPRLQRPALPLGTPTVGEQGGVFGHPGGAPLRIAPFVVDRQITATGTDIYGHNRTSRQVLELAAALAAGDSGSALVDAQGQVVGVAFAISTDQAGLAYALAPSELRSVLAAPHPSAVSTEGCAT